MAATFDTSVKAERERSERPKVHYINTGIAGEKIKVPKAGLIYRIFRAISRSVRRSLTFMRRSMSKVWHLMPQGFRNAFRYACGFLGFFMAYLICYIAVILAFTYSFLLGMATVFVIGMLIYALIDAFS